MKTYLFYTTHLIMIACAAVISLAAWPKRVQLINIISPLKKLKAIYRSLYIKALIINMLNICLQISAQLLK